MEAVEIKGKFVDENQETLDGWIKFIPSNIWVDEGEFTYPCLAPEVDLIDGMFKVLVTRTDQTELPWHYTVITPIGTWTIKVEGKGPLQLKNLLPDRHKR